MAIPSVNDTEGVFMKKAILIALLFAAVPLINVLGARNAPLQ